MHGQTHILPHRLIETSPLQRMLVAGDDEIRKHPIADHLARVFVEGDRQAIVTCSVCPTHSPSTAMSIPRTMLRLVRTRAPSSALSRPMFTRGIHVTRTRCFPGDPYPLPLSPELEKQRAAPHGSVESSTSSTLNTETEEDWPMPQPLDRTGEDEKTLRARLVYQTRKRGMLEGDLLLSTFARDHLGSMSMKQLQEFDKVSRRINTHSLGAPIERAIADEICADAR